MLSQAAMLHRHGYGLLLFDFRAHGESEGERITFGHLESLDARAAVEHWKASGLSLAPILEVPAVAEGAALHRTSAQDHGLEKALDNELIAMCGPALESGEPIRGQVTIRNVNRTVGTMLGLVTASLSGIERLSFPKAQRYAHALAGITIFLCGVGIQFLGL